MKTGNFFALNQTLIHVFFSDNSYICRSEFDMVAF